VGVPRHREDPWWHSPLPKFGEGGGIGNSIQCVFAARTRWFRFGGQITATKGSLPTSFSQEVRLTDSNFKERRGQQRIHFEAPATVTAGQHSIAASTKDATNRGLFFFADARLELDSEIDIVIMLPEEVGLPLGGMVCCHGRVVRADSAGGRHGFAVQIDRFAPVPQV
jgi:hypothetical protein